jgi:hypothetical protein
MKNIIKLALLAIIVMLASCKKNNAVNDPIEGKWTISSFVDSGTDKTSQFVAYDFSFDNKGNLSVNGGSMMSMCGWSHVDSIYHFNMMGMHSDVVNTLDDDWTMTNLTGTTCSFIDHNPIRDCRFTMLRK